MELTNSLQGKIYKRMTLYKDTVEEKMPLHALYTKITSGKLLDGATVFTTIRATVISCVRNIEFSRVVEILGFSSEQVKNYVEKYTGDDKDAGKTIWQHISNNFNLFSLCYIPVNCFIICSCLLHILKIQSTSYSADAFARLPTKLTHIYSFAVKLIFFRHSNRYRNKTVGQDEIFTPFDKLPEDVKGNFKKLGTIAFKGIKEGRLMFESDEVTNLEDCGLLHRLPDLKPEVKRPLERPKAQYCFQHLTIQEFFAAKHLTDMGEAELREFVSSHITDGAWQVVLQFVAGLLSDREEPLTDIFTNLLPMSTEKEEEYELEPGIMATCWPESTERDIALTLCHCLYEIDANTNYDTEDSVVRNIITQTGCNALVFDNFQLGPVDCTAIVNFLKMQNAILMIDLRCNNIGSPGCKEIGKLCSRSVIESNCKPLRSLNLSRNKITDDGVKYLADALKDSNCKINSLNLSENKITEKGVKYLADALKDSNCKLNSLNLASNVTAEGVKYLADALKDSNCKLNSLHLPADNFWKKTNVTDEGVKYLAEALKHNNCKLNSLNLAHNKLTDEGVKYLAEALKHSNCKLNSLNIARNKLTDEKAKYLAEALEHTNCKLNSLKLPHNKLTDEGAKCLAEALKHSNCKLNSLNLAFNKSTDEGAKYLAEALKHTNCKLKSLDLWQNNVADEGAKCLAEALKHSNCKLNSLNLAHNKLTDEGAKCLAEALKHTNCKLKGLDLWQNNVTDEGAKCLAEALKHSNCKLNSLNLAFNKSTDEGAKYLAEALKHTNCKLKSLDLWQNNVTDEGAKCLAEALKHTNCKLNSLNLAQNKLTDKGAKYLAEALKHTNCKLNSLKLPHYKLTDEGAKCLAEALKHTQTKLQLEPRR